MIQARGNERTSCGCDTCHDDHHQGPFSSPSALAIWNRRIHTAKKRSDDQNEKKRALLTLPLYLRLPFDPHSFLDSAYNDWVVFPPIHLHGKMRFKRTFLAAVFSKNGFKQGETRELPADVTPVMIVTIRDRFHLHPLWRSGTEGFTLRKRGQMVEMKKNPPHPPVLSPLAF
ncbi:hypothetical protein CDAR_581261 [Caerostris darwini]|uniref:Uncharacterized protein n=1 Tax=Caerostris darwini TaxID=1538125 RepID=A0AAV4PJF7_9ARAC|nr:hypothetical protein CDAR_581261 [Caerostris darwini]